MELSPPHKGLESITGLVCRQKATFDITRLNEAPPGCTEYLHSKMAAMTVHIRMKGKFLLSRDECRFRYRNRIRTSGRRKMTFFRRLRFPMGSEYLPPKPWIGGGAAKGDR